LCTTADIVQPSGSQIENPAIYIVELVAIEEVSTLSGAMRSIFQLGKSFTISTASVETALEYFKLVQGVPHPSLLWH
jgi:hypothetical protein